MQIKKKITLLILVFCFALTICACEQKQFDENTPSSLNDLEQGDEEAAALHNIVDDAIIPLAIYDQQKNQLIRYNWHLDTGEITDTGLVILYPERFDFFDFKWDGKNYIAVDNSQQQIIGGPGIQLEYKNFRNPSYSGYIIKNFSQLQNGSAPYINYAPIIIGNEKQEYVFDFTDIQIPGGNEESYIISSFYFLNRHAYFLLYSLLDAETTAPLVVVKYDMEQETYQAQAVINCPAFVGAMPPVGNQLVNASANSFLVCNYLDGLYQIDGDTYTAQKLYDNLAFLLDDYHNYYHIYISAASYYNGYLLLTIPHTHIETETVNTVFVVLKYGAVIAKMNTQEQAYLPNL